MARVVHLTTVHGRYDVRIFHKQCRTLTRHGHDVTLVVQDGKGNEKIEGVNIIDLGNPHANRVRRILFSPWHVWQCIHSLPADIIHFHDPELLPVCLLLKTSRRLVYDAHEDYPRLILGKHWIHPALRKISAHAFELFEYFATKRLDGIVCATPFIQHRFTQINPICINVNNFPIQDDASSKNLKERTSRTICFPGTIKREYGINELLVALEMLQDVTLILCGPFESSAYKEELMAMPGWKFVDYRGIVTHEQVGRILADCLAGMVTLLPSRTNNDSLPIKMFEYMAAGLPVIASDFFLWKEIVEDTNCGICVNPANPEEIASAIKRVLQYPDLAKSMGQNGRTAVSQKYNWEFESRKLIRLYDNLLS